jgi:hypothetical protein
VLYSSTRAQLCFRLLLVQRKRENQKPQHRKLTGLVQQAAGAKTIDHCRYFVSRRAAAEQLDQKALLKPRQIVQLIVAAIIGAPFLSKNRDSRYTTTNEQ